MAGERHPGKSLINKGRLHNRSTGNLPFLLVTQRQPSSPLLDFCMQISHPGQIRAPRNWQLDVQEAPPPSQQPLRFSQSRKHRQMVHLRGTMAILPPSTTREAKTSLNGVPANFASIPSVPFVRFTVVPHPTRPLERIQLSPSRTQTAPSWRRLWLHLRLEGLQQYQPIDFTYFPEEGPKRQKNCSALPPPP